MTDVHAGSEVVIVAPTSKVTKVDAQTARSNRAELCLWQLVNAAKAQLSLAQQVNIGLHEGEAFLEAIAAGGKHPLIRTYEERGRYRGRRDDGGNVRHAKRLVILGIICLDRTGIGSKELARAKMREHIQRTPLFGQVPSLDTLEHWERDMHPRLTMADEVLLARAINRCGVKDLDQLADYFLGMAHSVGNPRARAVVQA